MIVPPPTPKRPLKIPAAVPIAASFSVWAEGIWQARGQHRAAILDAVPVNL